MSRRSCPRSSGDIWRCFCGWTLLTLLPIRVAHIVTHALAVLLAHLLLPGALACAVPPAAAFGRGVDGRGGHHHGEQEP